MGADLFASEKESIGFLSFELETKMILRGQPFCEKVSKSSYPQGRHHLRR